jgi:hypothetical protein
MVGATGAAVCETPGFSRHSSTMLIVPEPWMPGTPASETPDIPLAVESGTMDSKCPGGIRPSWSGDQKHNRDSCERLLPKRPEIATMTPPTTNLGLPLTPPPDDPGTL